MREDVTKYNVFSHWLKLCKDIGRRPVLMWPLSLLLLAVVLVAAEQDERGGADAHLLAPRGLYLGTHALSVMYSLQWRHMSVMMFQITHCLFNRLFRQQIDGLMQKRHNSIANALELCLFCIKPSKIEHQSFTSLALCEGNPPVTGGFPSQRASNVERISMSWRHHVLHCLSCTSLCLLSKYTANPEIILCIAQPMRDDVTM